MNKKGFSAIEMGVVIVLILAISCLFLIRSFDLFSGFKDKNFKLNASEILNTAIKEMRGYQMLNNDNYLIYSKSKTSQCKKQISIDSKYSDKIEYFIEFDENYNAIRYYVTNGVFQFGIEKNDIQASDIKEIERIEEIDSENVFKIECEDVVIKNRKCENKLITEKGSFSLEKDEKSMCVDLEEYDYKKYKYSNPSSEKNGKYNILMIKVKIEDPTAYLDVYKGSNQEELLLSVNYECFHQKKYNISSGFFVDDDELIYVLGKYDVKDLDIMNYGEESLPEYEFFYVNSYKEDKYDGLWISNPKNITGIKNLFKYNLKGFKKCDNDSCSPNEYFAVFDETKKEDSSGSSTEELLKKLVPK